MNRAIKFRIWNPQNKLMEYWHDGFSEDTDILGEVFKCLDSYGYVIQQFTGLSDKDGKEIYEGDIVEITGFKGLAAILCKVLFMEGNFVFKCLHADRTLSLIWPQDLQKFDLVTKIVGNVFENSELLS